MIYWKTDYLMLNYLTKESKLSNIDSQQTNLNLGSVRVAEIFCLYLSPSSHHS